MGDDGGSAHTKATSATKNAKGMYRERRGVRVEASQISNERVSMMDPGRAAPLKNIGRKKPTKRKSQSETKELPAVLGESSGTVDTTNAAQSSKRGSDTQSQTGHHKSPKRSKYWVNVEAPDEHEITTKVDSLKGKGFC